MRMQYLMMLKGFHVMMLWYTSYFHISYRKMRKIDLTTSDFVTLCSGSLEDYENLFKRYKKKWGVITDDTEPNLFTNLNV